MFPGPQPGGRGAGRGARSQSRPALFPTAPPSPLAPGPWESAQGLLGEGPAADPLVPGAALRHMGTFRVLFVEMVPLTRFSRNGYYQRVPSVAPRSPAGEAWEGPSPSTPPPGAHAEGGWQEGGASDV